MHKYARIEPMLIDNGRHSFTYVLRYKEQPEWRAKPRNAGVLTKPHQYATLKKCTGLGLLYPRKLCI